MFETALLVIVAVVSFTSGALVFRNNMALGNSVVADVQALHGKLDWLISALSSLRAAAPVAAPAPAPQGTLLNVPAAPR